MSKKFIKIKTLVEKQPPLWGGHSFETKLELEQQDTKIEHYLHIFA